MKSFILFLSLNFLAGCLFVPMQPQQRTSVWMQHNDVIAENPKSPCSFEVMVRQTRISSEDKIQKHLSKLEELITNNLKNANMLGDKTTPNINQNINKYVIAIEYIDLHREYSDENSLLSIANTAIVGDQAHLEIHIEATKKNKKGQYVLGKRIATFYRGSLRYKNESNLKNIADSVTTKIFSITHIEGDK